MEKEKKAKLIKSIISFVISAIIGAGAAVGVITVKDDGTTEINKEEISQKAADKVMEKLNK